MIFLETPRLILRNVLPKDAALKVSDEMVVMPSEHRPFEISGYAPSTRSQVFGKYTTPAAEAAYVPNVHSGGVSNGKA